MTCRSDIHAWRSSAGAGGEASASRCLEWAQSTTGRRQRGFTLIEVLVAFGILALMLVALLQVFSLGLRSVNVSERHLIATMLMRSILDSLGTEIPIVAGERSGDIDDGYRWTTRIARSQTIAPVATAQWAYLPYEIELEIAWNGRPVTTLTTLRIVAELVGSATGNEDEEVPADEESN
jgi:general secretion pathway protein I